MKSFSKGFLFAVVVLGVLIGVADYNSQSRPIGTIVAGIVGDTVTATALRVDSSGYLQNESDIISIGGTATATNNGTASAGTIRVAVASDNTAFKVRSTPAMSGYTTDYLSVTTALPATSQSLMAVDTLLQLIYCNNLTGTAQTFQITDGNNAYIVGPEFSLAANSNTRFIDSPIGIEVQEGIKYSAANANAVRCQFSGKQ